jgi:hypothetical protein
VTRAIIAGGRDYAVGPKERRWLDGIHAALDISLVISGGAPGADAGGEKWANSREIELEVYPANWAKHGKAAGPKRNQIMANRLEPRCYEDPGDVVILFPGGTGTDSMRRIAKKRGVRVIEYSDKETK